MCRKLALNPLKPVLPPAQLDTLPRLPRDEGGACLPSRGGLKPLLSP
jgi:hypothetical protein